MHPKFLCYLDSDGFPIIFPYFQARAIEYNKIVFPFIQFKDRLEMIPDSSPIAFYALNMETMNLLTNGISKGKEKGWGIMQIEEVYNGMPPLAGKIYPQKDRREKIE